MRWQLDELDLGVGNADALRSELHHCLFFWILNFGIRQKRKTTRTGPSLAIIRMPPGGARRKIKRAVFTALFFSLQHAISVLRVAQNRNRDRSGDVCVLIESGRIVDD